jgi:hypothetical protein
MKGAVLVTNLTLHIHLLSDTTFGRGDGVAGAVNEEVEHDPQTGLPFIKGRTIKGLLVESCADLLFSLQGAAPTLHPYYHDVARRLFGSPGSDLESQGVLVVGNARLDDDLVQAVRQSRFKPSAMLEALTTVRYQTAVDATTDAPQDGSLRATRAVLRETTFYAPIETLKDLSPQDIAWLAACARGVRRGGMNRNRGQGRLALTLYHDGTPVDHNAIFSGGQ